MSIYAPINVKPEGGGGGGGSGNPQEFDCGVYPHSPGWGILIGHHAFHLSIL